VIRPFYKREESLMVNLSSSDDPCYCSEHPFGLYIEQGVSDILVFLGRAQ